MSQYRRIYRTGAYYFFTVVTHQRKHILTKPKNIIQLKTAIQKVKQKYPFELNAIVILPDHLHCIWKLPDNEKDFSTRWRLIKRYFSLAIKAAINNRQEKEVWQKRFWEHMIRNEADFEKHVDYIHFNPVKHSYVRTAKDWPYSSFHSWSKKGLYKSSWGFTEPLSLKSMDIE